MNWMIWVCFIFIMFYSSYPGKVRKLENRVKKIERNEKRNEKGGDVMSNIIKSLIGKECKIRIDEDFLVGNIIENCLVIDADEEWIKLSYKDKKGCTKIKIIRIDLISNIEMILE